MAGLSSRRRLPAPVARALLVALVVVVAIAAGVSTDRPLLALVVAAAVLGFSWLASVGLQQAGSRPARIDPFTVSDPWRRFVQDAVSARARFREAVTTTQPGPLRDTLTEIAERLDTGVEETWRIAQRGEAMVRSRRGIDTSAIARDLAQTSTAQAQEPDDTRLADTRAALEAQQGSADRLDRVIDDARSQLRLLDARLDEAVARALELSAQAGAPDSVLGLSNDVDAVVTDLEALRQALEETHGPPGGLPQGPAPG